jgi:hypothetical protein
MQFYTDILTESVYIVCCLLSDEALSLPLSQVLNLQVAFAYAGSCIHQSVSFILF